MSSNQGHNTALSELLELGLAQPAEQRVVWVDALGPEHDALKPRLRALLERSVRAERAHTLRTLPKLVESSLHDVVRFSRNLHQPGEEIAGYRLVRVLGDGAMGSVWLAEPSAPELRAPELPSAVAIKFAHMAARRPDLRLRLERERRLLAALEHPNIARLYDAGATRDGQPYLVMEYVEGEALDVHMRERTPELRRRLTLFLQVAHAVAHAHQREILHRDIKPANVLVDARGSARLLDFGVGKLLSDTDPSLTADRQLTAANGRPLTPAYASPEQMLGQPVGFASDIYVLGVLLYEILTGGRPYVISERRSLRALMDAIVVRPVAPPSQVVADPSAAAELHAALDALVIKALNKKPEQRHASADEFAAGVAAVLRAL